MSKKAYLSAYLSKIELKNHYLSATDPIESRRWHLIWLISEGWTIKTAAIAIGINYDYAKEIVKSYNHQGEQGIINKLGQPRKPLSFRTISSDNRCRQR